MPDLLHQDRQRRVSTRLTSVVRATANLHKLLVSSYLYSHSHFQQTVHFLQDATQRPHVLYARWHQQWCDRSKLLFLLSLHWKEDQKVLEQHRPRNFGKQNFHVWHVTTLATIISPTIKKWVEWNNSGSFVVVVFVVFFLLLLLLLLFLLLLLCCCCGRR